MDRYATHLPVLQALGQKLPIQRVLELGGGTYSTAAFLDPDIYPRLEVLDTVEVIPDWQEALQAAHGEDPRWRLMKKLPPTLKAGYDLVFVDDGQCAADRIKSIEAVAGYPALVVIHDYEVAQYRAVAVAVAQWDSIHIYRAQTPHTAVCWSGSRPEVGRVCQMYL